MFAYCTLGVPLDFLGGPLSPDSAPTLAYGVCNDDLTGLAGLGIVARLARFLGLPEKLAAAVRFQRRRRGGSDGQMLLRPLIRYCVGSVGRLTRSGLLLRLLCSRSNLQLDWLLPAASRMEPG